MRMSKYTELFDYIEEVVPSMPAQMAETFKEVREFYEQSKSAEKQTFTETGLTILEYMQGSEAKNMKAKDIAEGVLLSSRKVSGAMRKLVNDGYVEKFGTNPVIYSITTQGKEIDLTSYKATLDKEE